jgi:lysophospholipase L1-like esterase
MKYVFAITFGIIISVVLTEIGLRITNISYPIWYQSDPLTGQSLRPNTEVFQIREGRALVKINSFGMRDRPRSLLRPDNIKLRVALLGDSFTEGPQVPYEVSFPALLEVALNRCLGEGVEVLNFGVSGFGQTQELLLLRERVLPFKPDVVILAVTTGNDIADNLLDLKGDNNVPYAYISPSGGLEIDMSFQKAPGYQLRASPLGESLQQIIRFSRVAQVMNEARFQYRQKALVSATSGNEPGLHNGVYEVPKGPWIAAWSITERLIKEMQRETASLGSRFIMTSLSNGIQVWADLERQKALLEKEGIREIFYPERQLSEIAYRYKIPYLPLAPLLKEIAQRESLFLHGFNGTLGSGHWNEKGHHYGSKLLKRWLCRELKR